MTYEEYLAVPYVLVMESVQRPDGDWTRRASYPELPGCEVESESPVDALDQLDALRQRRIAEMLRRGERIPVPRAPLRTSIVAIDPDRAAFARWLVEEGRLTDA